MFSINSSAVSAESPLLFKRTETPLFKYNLFFARVGVQELAKVFVCRKDEVREMTSKWVLDLAGFELWDYFSAQLDPCRIPAFDLHPSANVLANVRCVVQNSTSRFWEHTTLKSKTSRFVQKVDKRFSVERARKIFGEIDLKDGLAPGL